MPNVDTHIQKKGKCLDLVLRLPVDEGHVMLLIYVCMIFSFCLLGCSANEEEDELEKVVFLEEDKAEWSLPEEVSIEEPAQMVEETISE